MAAAMRRRTPAKAFYLAFFALFSGACQAASSTRSHPDVCAVGICATPAPSRPPPHTVSQLEPKAQVSDACASYADLDRLNHRLQPYVKNLANNTDFFSYYRLNLYNKDCPFWHDDDGLCGNIACAVTTLENEEDIPQIWRAEELSKLEGPKAEHPGRKQQRERRRPLMNQLGQDVGESCVVEYDDECDDRDYCVSEDESASAKGDYVSLAENPERFTGYAGEASHRIWGAIYRENCFSKPSGSSHSAAVPGLSAPHPGFSQNQAQAALDFKQIVKARDRQEAIKSGVPVDELEFEDECLEKRVFYRVISGMHASISTHLCYEYLNQTTGEWSPNLQCYKERLHEHPERVSNLYFNYALMLRAVGKLRDYVQDYTFCTGDPIQDKKTKDMIRKLSSAIPDGPQIFDESVMFQDGSVTENGISLKEDFRNRFRNVSRIMDCVGCDKCRLWGKLQTNGFGTALKVLFEFGNGHAGEKKPLLRRTELVALINTLDKISTSLKAIEHFRGLIEDEIPDAPSSPPPDSAEAGLPLPGSSGQTPSDAEVDDWPNANTSDPASCQPAPDETLIEIFWTEYNNMYRAISFVLKQWYNTPRTLATIAYGEFMRLTEYWLGLRVRERNWEFRFPRVDEL